MSEIRVTSVVGENGGDRVGLTTGLTVGPLTGTTGIGATISHQGHAQFAGVCTATSFVGSGANLTSLPASGGMTLLASATLSSSGTVAANISFNTTGYEYLYGKLYSITRSGGGNVGDVGLRWNGTSSTVYDFVMQRMDNNGSGSERYTQGANQFYFNMQGVAAFTSGRNQAVFELHLVNDGVRKPFNMKASGELSAGPIVLTTDGMLDLTSSITSLEITSTNTDIDGGTLKLYGVK